MEKIKKILFDFFDFTKIQKPIKNIMKLGISFCCILVLFATFLLSLYIEFHSPNYLYTIGGILFKSSTTFIVFFLICGIGFNKIAIRQ